jgi:hypothetical protein
MEVTNGNEKHSKIPNSVEDNLIEQRIVIINASLPLWHSYHHQREFFSILSCYPTGLEPQLKGCYPFLQKKKNGGVEHNKVPESPFASEVKCCHCTLCLIVPHIIHFDMLHVGTCQQEDVFDCIETNTVVGVDQLVVGRDLARTCLGK